jgi:endonuclease/exonuclease/phosphatase family metal-dependent hydrolase
MKRCIAISTWICLGVISAHCGVQAADEMNVKVMTFNIRITNSGDGPNRWEQRREMAVDIIRRFEGDFVGIQEAMPDQSADLQKMLPEYKFLVRSRDADPDRGEATPLLYRHKRWRLDPDRHGFFWFSDTPEKPGSTSWGNFPPRMAVWGRFIETGTQRGVYVYNIHLDHRSEPSRQKSAALLATRIAERSPKEPVIVTGDFNSGETGGATAYLTGKKPGSPVPLVDSFRVLHPDEEYAGTFNGFRGIKTGRKIDFILTLPTTKVRSAEILRDNRDGRYPSDHFPVTAELSFDIQDSQQGVKK